MHETTSVKTSHAPISLHTTASRVESEGNLTRMATRRTEKKAAPFARRIHGQKALSACRAIARPATKPVTRGLSSFIDRHGSGFFADRMEKRAEPARRDNEGAAGDFL